RVVGEMVLDAPDRFEAQRLGHVGERQLVQIDLVVAERAAGVLEDGGHSDMHGALLSAICPMVNARLPAWEAAMRRRQLESAPFGRHIAAMRPLLAALSAFALLLATLPAQAQIGVPQIEQYVNSLRTVK